MELQGLNTLLIQLKSFDDKVLAALDTAMLESANLIKDDAIDLINSTAGIVSKPGDHPSTQTGNLVSNITVEAEDGGYSVGSRGSGAPYGLSLELGTSQVAARPWLLPTFQADLPAIEEIVINSLRDIR